MKVLNLLVLAALVVGGAEAEAGYSISLSVAPGAGSADYNPIVTSIGQQGGASTFTFIFNGSSDVGKYLNYAYNVTVDGGPVASPNPFSIGSINAGYSLTSPIASADLGKTYTLTIPWTPTSGAGLYDINLSVWTATTSGGAFDSTPGHAAFASATSYVNIQPALVPEPAQAVVGAMIFGFGAVVFTGRRWMKKTA